MVTLEVLLESYTNQWAVTPLGGAQLDEEPVNDTPTAREVVIDGPNVGMSHSGNEWPASAQGIESVIRYFTDLGWPVKAFVPRYYMHRKERRGVDNPELLERLQKEGTLVTTPSQDHDDHYWLAYAMKTGALVITNDRMKNHAEEHKEGKDAFYQWRESRVISYMFVGDSFLPNPAFEIPEPPLPEPSSDNKQENSKESIESKPKKTVAKKEAKPRPKKSSTPRSKKGQESQSKSSSSKKKSSQKHTADDFTRILKDNLSPEMKVSAISTEMVEWCNKAWGTKFQYAREIRSHVGLPTSPPMSDILSRLLADQVGFTGKSHDKICQFDRGTSSVRSWLESRMKAWVRVTRLGQELSTDYGVTSPKTVLKEHEGITGSTFSSQLRNLFGKENLEFRGKHGSTEVILKSNPSRSSSRRKQKESESELTPTLALEKILTILEVPESYRRAGLKPPSLFRRIIRRILLRKGLDTSINYALLGQRFKEATGYSIKQVFESSEDLLSTFSTNHPNMKATIDGNTFTLRA